MCPLAAEHYALDVWDGEFKLIDKVKVTTIRLPDNLLAQVRAHARAKNLVDKKGKPRLGAALRDLIRAALGITAHDRGFEEGWAEATRAFHDALREATGKRLREAEDAPAQTHEPDRS